jgi:hypothetical protein
MSFFNKSRKRNKSSKHSFLNYFNPLSNSNKDSKNLFTFTNTEKIIGPTGAKGLLEHNGHTGKKGPTGMDSFTPLKNSIRTADEFSSKLPNQTLDTTSDVSFNSINITNDINIHGNLYANYPDETIPISAIIGNVNMNIIQGPTGPIGPQGAINNSSDLSFYGNVSFNNPIKLDYSPNLINKPNLGYQISGFSLNSGSYNLPQDNTVDSYIYSSIILPQGIWFLESQILISSQGNNGTMTAYLSLSKTTDINYSNCLFTIIPLNQNHNYCNKLSGVFTVFEETTIYSIINVFNVNTYDSNYNNQNSTVLFTLEPTPLLIATRIA